MSHFEAVRGSMLWSAYGDALGFMSELVDQNGLVQRTGHDVVSEATTWKYRVGGRYGVVVPMLAGTYSDDTQLRLATARTISTGGDFNIDAFSKVELPVWLSYALGAGRGTKAAASNLARDNVQWFANFYATGDVTYMESGGNGAAMRIQPHVWASPIGGDTRKLILNVIRNVVTTHGHPRALVGAVLYALVLLESLKSLRCPPPQSWLEQLELVAHIPTLIASDINLSAMWLPEWERQSKESLPTALRRVIAECEREIGELGALTDESPKRAYLDFLSRIDAFNRAQRGSGTKSVIAALALAWIFQHDPIDGMRTGANALGSDTDTITSMAGAILGITRTELPGEVLDRPLLLREADRLSRIANGDAASDFSYPSLLSWKPPRTAIDSVGVHEDGLAIAGLGKIEPLDSNVFASNERQPAAWRWMRTTFGQTLMVKMRTAPPALNPGQMPQTDRVYDGRDRTPKQEITSAREPILTSVSAPQAAPPQAGQALRKLNSGVDLGQITNAAIQSQFDPRLIGELLLELADRPFGIENAIGFAAIIAKARQTRGRAAR